MKNKILSWLIVMVLIVSNINAAPEQGAALQQTTNKEQITQEIHYDELPENKLFNGEGYSVELDKDSNLKITKTKVGDTKIEIIGKGNIEINNHPMPFNTISSAIFILNKDNLIRYAEFISDNGGTYEFLSENGALEFTANPKSKVLYEPSKNTFKGRDLKQFSFQKEEEDSVFNIGPGEFEIKFKDDNSGKIDKAVLPPNSIYNDNKNYLSYSSREEFVVYFDGRDVETLNENAISLSGNLIKGNGIINIENEEFGLTYNGDSRKVHVEYDSLYQTFDVSHGNARISNGLQEIKFENDHVQLNVKNLEKEGRPFAFRYLKNKEDNNEVYGVISYEGGKPSLATFNENDKTMVMSQLFSDFEGQIESKPEIAQEPKDELQAITEEIELLKEQGNPIPATLLERKEQIEFSKLEEHINALLKNGKPKEAKEELYKFLQEIKSTEVKAVTSLMLSELYKTNAKASESFREQAKEAFKELQKDESKKDEATIKLGLILLEEGKLDEAQKELTKLASSDNNKRKSNVMSAISIIRANKNLPESSLLIAQKAVELDSENENARSHLVNLRSSYFNIIKSGFGQSFKENFKQFEEKWNLVNAEGESRYSGLLGLTNTYNLIAAQLGYTTPYLEKLEDDEAYTGKVYLGITTLDRLNRGNIDLSEFAKADYTKRKELIAKAIDASSLSEDEIKGLFLSLGEEKRKELIKKSIGRIPKDDKDIFLLKDLNLRENLLKETKGEEYAAADQMLSSLAISTMYAQKEWDVVLTMVNGDVKKAEEILKEKAPKNKQFKFKTGEGYLDPGILETTWKDYVAGAANVKNIELFLLPGALATKIGPLLKAVPGAAKVIGATAAVKEELTLSRLFASKFAAKKIPTLTKAATSWVGSELREETVESVIFGSLGGNTAELLSAYAPMLKAKKAIGAIDPSKLIVFSNPKGEKIPGIEFKTKEDLSSFLKELKLKASHDDFYEINGNKFIATVNGESKTKEFTASLSSASIEAQEAATSLMPFDISKPTALESDLLIPGGRHVKILSTKRVKEEMNELLLIARKYGLQDNPTEIFGGIKTNIKQTIDTETGEEGLFVEIEDIVLPKKVLSLNKDYGDDIIYNLVDLLKRSPRYRDDLEIILGKKLEDFQEAIEKAVGEKKAKQFLYQETEKSYLEAFTELERQMILDEISADLANKLNKQTLNEIARDIGDDSLLKAIEKGTPLTKSQFEKISEQIKATDWDVYGTPIRTSPTHSFKEKLKSAGASGGDIHNHPRSSSELPKNNPSVNDINIFEDETKLNIIVTENQGAFTYLGLPQHKLPYREFDNSLSDRKTALAFIKAAFRYNSDIQTPTSNFDVTDRYYSKLSDKELAEYARNVFGRTKASDLTKYLYLTNMIKGGTKQSDIDAEMSKLKEFFKKPLPGKAYSPETSLEAASAIKANTQQRLDTQTTLTTTKETHESASGQIKEAASDAYSFWTKRPVGYEVTDSNGDYIGELILPTKGKELRVLARNNNIIPGGEIRGYATEDMKRTSKETFIIEKYVLPRKKDTLITGLDYIDTAEITDIRAKSTALKEEISRLLKDVENDLGDRELAEFGFKDKKFSGLSAQEKDVVLKKIRGYSSGSYPELEKKYRDKIEALEHKTFDITYNLKIEPLDYGIMKDRIEVGPVEYLPILDRIETANMVSARSSVWGRGLVPPIDFHTHPIVWGEFGRVSIGDESIDLGNEISSLIRSRVYGSYNKKRISSEEFKLKFEEERVKIIEKLNSAEEIIEKRLENTEKITDDIEDLYNLAHMSGSAESYKKSAPSFVAEILYPRTPEEKEKIDLLLSKIGVYISPYSTPEQRPQVVLLKVREKRDVIDGLRKEKLKLEKELRSSDEKIKDLQAALANKDIESVAESLVAKGYIGYAIQNPSMQDALHLLSARDWVKLGSREVRASIILNPSASGRSLLMQINGDDKLLLIIDVGNTRFTRRIPIEEVRKSSNKQDTLVSLSNEVWIEDLTGKKQVDIEAIQRTANTNTAQTQIINMQPQSSISEATIGQSQTATKAENIQTTKENLERIITAVRGKNPTTGETSTSKLYAGLTEKNAKDIFQTSLEHKFGEGIMGSKAIVYQDYRGNYQVAFMTETTNTHHRQAAATIAKLIDSPNSDTSVLERKVNALYDGNSDEAKDLLTKVAGFELQYDKKTGKIIGIQQDSWLTKEQIRKGRFVDKEVEEDMISELLAKIDQSIIDTKVLENKNFEKLFIKR